MFATELAPLDHIVPLALPARSIREPFQLLRDTLVAEGHRQQSALDGTPLRDALDTARVDAVHRECMLAVAKPGRFAPDHVGSLASRQAVAVDTDDELESELQTAAAFFFEAAERRQMCPLMLRGDRPIGELFDALGCSTDHLPGGDPGASIVSEASTFAAAGDGSSPQGAVVPLTTPLQLCGLRVGTWLMLRHRGFCNHAVLLANISLEQCATKTPLSRPTTVCDSCHTLPATTLLYGHHLCPRNPTVLCVTCVSMLVPETHPEVIRVDLPVGVTL